MMSDDNKKKLRRLILWVSFSVVFALGPLFVNFLLERDNSDFHWSNTIHRGELFLIAAALCADAIGRIWNQRAVNGLPGTVCLVASVFILFASSVEFGVAAPKLDSAKFLVGAQVRDSIVVFCAAVASAFMAVVIEE